MVDSVHQIMTDDAKSKRKVCSRHSIGDANPIDRPRKKPRVRWLYGNKYMTDNFGNDRLIFSNYKRRSCAKPRGPRQKPIDTIYYSALKNMNESGIMRTKIFNSVTTYILTFAS